MGDQARSLAQPGRPLLRMLGHTTVVLVLLTVGYYTLPSPTFWAEPDAMPRLAVSVVVIALLAVVFRLEGRQSRHQPAPYFRIQWLLSALYLLVLVFALLYSAVQTASPQQFAGISNRTDALYFSVTVMSTVGFGDVHAVATPARVLVTLHMLFNLIYIGTAIRILSAKATDSTAAN